MGRRAIVNAVVRIAEVKSRETCYDIACRKLTRSDLPHTSLAVKFHASSGSSIYVKIRMESDRKCIPPDCRPPVLTGFGTMARHTVRQVPTWVRRYNEDAHRDQGGRCRFLLVCPAR